MRVMSPNNPYTVLIEDLEFKEITGDGVVDKGDGNLQLSHDEGTGVGKTTTILTLGEGFGWDGNTLRYRTGNVSLLFTAIYGLHTVETRKSLWQSLTHILPSVGAQPWLLAGDFNSILSTEDRINGTPVTTAEIQDFSNFIVSTGLCPLQSVDHYFSWHKSPGEGQTASRIDWCLGNAAWVHKFSGVPTEYLNPSISDHSPLLINCLPDKAEGGRPFRFLNYLSEHSQFLPLVEDVWSSTEVRGSYMYKLWYKLKIVKSKLKCLHREEFAGVKERVDKARVHLDNVQNALQTAPTADLFEQEKVCIANLKKWLRVDEIALRQKSRIQWLQVGDSNHQFFFSAMKERNRQNRISVLYDENNNKLVEPDGIQGEIVGFDKTLLGSASSSLPAIHIPTVRSGTKLSNSAKNWLTREVTTLEIDQALKGTWSRWT
ncbi:uncharacterized protein [Spinacia oleracea]|uniref:Endonuclease/exonuclease/phosphatase domain-containing protein n=1 Tax=Spinacia oleracea TaxID=3562 RepID=A0ABM3RRF9_SPIOL|nr:uncharacterized protein LOC130471882 [Spinacia oleracea]